MTLQKPTVNIAVDCVTVDLYLGRCNDITLKPLIVPLLKDMNI